MSILCVVSLLTMSSVAVLAADDVNQDKEPGMQIETVDEDGQHTVTYYSLSELACDTYDQDGNLICSYDPADGISLCDWTISNSSLPGLSTKYYYPSGSSGINLAKNSIVYISLSLSQKTDLTISLTNGTSKQTTDAAPTAYLTCTKAGYGKIKVYNKLSKTVTVNGSFGVVQ